MPQGDFAPIALFIFKRPEHTRNTLESLARNPQFRDSPLFIFCDAARREDERAAVAASRKVVREWDHPHKQIIEAANNLGLANSIIAGVTRLCEDYGRAIVVEDDLIVSSHFLAYMNEALVRYESDSRVLQVSGYMWPIVTEGDNDAVFLPITCSWGWATWRRAWRLFDPTASASREIMTNASVRRKFDIGGSFPFSIMLLNQLRGKIDSWAIRWYLSVFKESGLVLYPSRSLVNNGGFGAEATHSKKDDRLRFEVHVSDCGVKKFPLVQMDSLTMKILSGYLADDTPQWKVVLREIALRVMGYLFFLRNVR